MLKDELLLVVGFHHYGIFIEGADAARQFDAAEQVDGDDRLIFSCRVEERILYILCRLAFHRPLSLQNVKYKQSLSQQIPQPEKPNYAPTSLKNEKRSE